VHHLVQQCLDRLIPAMPPDVAPANHDLGGMSLLPAKSVVTEPRLHPAGNANRNCAQLAAEFCRVELMVRPRKLAHEMNIHRP